MPTENKTYTCNKSNRTFDTREKAIVSEKLWDLADLVDQDIDEHLYEDVYNVLMVAYESGNITLTEKIDTVKLIQELDQRLPLPQNKIREVLSGVEALGCRIVR